MSHMNASSTSAVEPSSPACSPKADSAARIMSMYLRFILPLRLLASHSTPAGVVALTPARHVSSHVRNEAADQYQ